MKKLLILTALICALFSKATEITYHYDTADEIKNSNDRRYKEPEKWLSTDIKAAGAGGLKLGPQGSGFGENFKEKLPAGVLTLWAFDDYFDIIDCWKWHHVNFMLGRKINGKDKTFKCEIRRYREGWRADLNDSSSNFRFYPLPDGPNHYGWTRFDIVNPAGAEPQQFTIYIDGHKAFTTDGKFDYIAGVSTNWIPYVDEVCYNSDPTSFRPNPIKEILPNNPYALVLLNPDEKLRVDLSVDSTGTRARMGELTVNLIDGRGEILASEKSKITWNEVIGDKLSVELPSPPRSGYFWLETRYQEPNGPVDITRRKINLQFLIPGFAQKAQAPLDLFRRPWDFIPIGENEPNHAKIRASEPTREELSVPVEPPTNWSKAFSLSGAWIDMFSYFNLRFSCHSAWYHQSVNIPEDWDGQKIMLEIENPWRIATVFADRKKVGQIEWPGGFLDLTDFAVPGKKLDLSIFVAADPVSGYFKLMRKVAGKDFQVPRSMKIRGLNGDVVLFPIEKKARIDGTAIETSVSQKKLTAIFELSGLSSGKTYTLRAAVANAGKVVIALPEKTFIAKKSNERITLSTTWENPILWDLNAPYLYDLNAVLLDDKNSPVFYLWPERFGFREVTGDGPDLTINGRPITLFHIGGAIGDSPANSKWCEKYGFLSFYGGFGKKNDRILDEAGKTRTGGRDDAEIVVNGPLDIAKSGQVDNPEFWRGVERMLDYQVRSQRNHPAVFFYRGVLGGGRNGNGGMYNPTFQNGTWINERRGNEVSMTALKAGKRMLDIIHKLDPSRLVSAQDSGSVNDTMHITEYAGFQPIQEFIERTEYWRKYGSKPFLISEQAAPMFPNWTDACSQGKGWRGVPCFAEWTAITKGDKAFERTEEDEKYLGLLETEVAKERQKMIDSTPDKLECEMKMKKIRMTLNPWFYMRKDDVLHNKVWKDRIREEVFNWRLNHLGLLGFWFSNMGPDLDYCYLEYQRPVTGFLGGTEENPTLKTHIFAPGETMRRSAILLNNSNKPSDLTCEWKLELNGKVVAKDSKTETIPAGGDVFVPITVKLPESDVDQSGKLTVDFIENGRKIRSDECDIDVIVPKNFKNKGKIALVDPQGDTAKALQDAGVDFQMMCFDEDFAAFDTIVFGRRAFNYEYDLLPEGIDLGVLAKKGKRILIMEQDEETLRDRFKLRTEYLSPRDVYGRIEGHPIIEGLSDNRLKYWRGSSSLTDGYEVSRKKKRISVPGEFGNGGTWLYNWNDDKLHTRPIKWGNTHNVATVTAIKPDTGNFRTLLDCGYDANYAAAWELDADGARIVFNQVDVSGRTETEPAATRYLQNLVRHVQDSSVSELKEAVYLGGSHGAELLKSIDVPFKTIETPETAKPKKNVLILGDLKTDQLKKWKDAIAKFAYDGGTIFCLPMSGENFAGNWTPFKVASKKKKVNHTVVGKPSNPLLAGLGNSDFYWKGNIEIDGIVEAEGAKLLLDTGVLVEVPYGKGRYVFCQIEPAMFGDIKLDHWLKPSKYNTERMLRTLLTNVGVRMNPPKLLFQPKAKEILVKTIALTGKWKVCQATDDENACPDKNDSAWRDITLPGAPQKTYPEWKGVKGAFWFRRDVQLDKLDSNESVKMEIGRVSGGDTVYVNGEKAAFTNSETNVNSVATIARDYNIPSNLFKRGENEIAIRVEYDTNAALGMRGSTGEIAAPMELKIYRTKMESKMPEAIDLSSRTEWWGHPVKKATDPWVHRLRKRIAVPEFIQPQRSEWSDLTGYFWYWYQFKIKEPIPEQAKPTLMIGAVDDEDTTYVNGVKIGHTGKDTNPDDYWMAPRAYPIPPGVLKVGDNIITILVNDFNVGGGICKGPVKIVFENPEETRKRKLAERPYIHPVGREDDPYWHHGF